MNTAESKKRYTPEEYLQLEETSLEKHQYFRGEIFELFPEDMSGGSEWHSLITMNMGRAIGNALKGKSCRVYDSNLRIGVPTTTLYTYPDLSVICGPTQLDTSDTTRSTATNPKVIVEVLSPSTEAYDRGRKFASYLTIETLREYVLVAQSRPRVETYCKQSDGTWVFAFFEGASAYLALRSLGVEVALADIFEGVEFPPAEPATVS
jgi:Uma2 family endonuclease